MSESLHNVSVNSSTGSAVRFTGQLLNAQLVCSDVPVAFYCKAIGAFAVYHY